MASTPATWALEQVLELLTAEGVGASRDAGSFNPDPVGVLIAMPELTGRTLSGATFAIPVLVVSGVPVNSPAVVDRLYAEADAIARILGSSSYRPTSWAGSDRVEPLPALEITATVTVTTIEEA